MKYSEATETYWTHIGSILEFVTPAIRVEDNNIL